MKCPACGFDLKKDFRFCPSCGTELPSKSVEENSIRTEKYIICDICGEENPDSNIDCQSCGAKLDRSKTVNRDIKEQTTAPVAEEKRGKEKPKQKDENVRESYKNAAKVKQESAPKIKNSTVKKNGNISAVNVSILIVGLLLLGYVILDLAGVFDSPKQEQAVNNSNGNSQGINLADVQEINQLEKAVMADTTNVQMVLQLAHKLGDSGFNERAVKYYEMYLRQNPRNADVQVDLGVVYFELKQYDKAKSRMMKGLKIDPNHQIANFNIGVVNSSEGKMDSAKIWWKKAVEINPATEIGRRAQELLNSH